MFKRTNERKNEQNTTFSYPYLPISDVEKQSSNTHESDYFMLLEDMCHSNKLPSSLSHLLHNTCQREMRGSAELLITVIYYLFLESGFVPTTLPAEQKSKIRTHWGFSFVAQIPDFSWKIAANEIVQEHQRLQHNEVAASTSVQLEQIFEFKLNLLHHSNDLMHLIIRKIFNGAALCISFYLSRQEQASSIILPVNEFIDASENVNFDRIQQNPQNFIRNVRKLSETIKQKLIAPVRNVVMYESAYPNAALHGMPKEVLWSLFKYLRFDLSTLQNVSQTSVYLRNMAISFLNESNIRLKHRRPTPIIYDPLNHINPHYSRYRINNGIFGGYSPHVPRRADLMHYILD